MITMVATTIPMMLQMRTCSVVDQPVILEQILVATERTITKAIIPSKETNMRFIKDEVIPIHKSPMAKPPCLKNNLT